MRSLALPLALVACLALLGGGAFLVTRGTGAAPQVAQPGAAPQPRAQPVVEAPAAELRSLGDAPVEPAAPATSTVAYPVEVELELLEPADVLRGEGLPALGSGRSARLRGQVSVGDRVGVPAVLEFTTGLNAGRRLETNAEGYFGAADLYPGPGLLRVSGSGLGGALREVRLLRDKETLLALAFGAPGSVGGTVFDEAGKPMAGVQVELDGIPGTTDEAGVFSYAGIPGGSDVALLLRASGYATQYHTLGVLAARSLSPKDYRFTMERGGSLEVAITRSAGVAGPARVLLATGIQGVKQPYAWHVLGPYEVLPGSSVRIDDLPPTKIAVRVEQVGARCVPAQADAMIRPNHVERKSFELEAAPALRGVVLDPEGLPVAEAEVRLEAPDRAAATMFALKTTPAAYELQFQPAHGAAVGRTRSDHQGRFVLGAWPEVAPEAYLVAESRDGSLRGGRAVRADAGEVELRLAPAQSGRARVELEFPGRAQGLPVVVSVDGQLRPEVVLGADEPLTVDGLAPGRWRLRARWNGEWLLGGPGHADFDLRDLERRSLPLPQGAITGQDADTLERSRG